MTLLMHHDFALHAAEALSAQTPDDVTADETESSLSESLGGERVPVNLVEAPPSSRTSPVDVLHFTFTRLAWSRKENIILKLKNKCSTQSHLMRL